jgi:hypothetical protein
LSIHQFVDFYIKDNLLRATQASNLFFFFYFFYFGDFKENMSFAAICLVLCAFAVVFTNAQSNLKPPTRDELLDLYPSYISTSPELKAHIFRSAALISTSNLFSLVIIFLHAQIC